MGTADDIQEEIVKDDLKEGEGCDEAVIAADLEKDLAGVMRVKRLLSDEGDESIEAKKRRTGLSDTELNLVNKLLMKWQLQQDAILRHVLETLTEVDLRKIDSSQHRPDMFNDRKGPAELVLMHSVSVRDARMGIPNGGPLDPVQAFKARFSLNAMQEKTMRGLNHKELRYVFDVFDGKTPFDEVVKEAKERTAEQGGTENAAPDALGVGAVSRFSRLELIDPMADCAVFGDANLTFSKRLAAHRTALGHVGRVIATTFEDLPTLRERYKEIDETIEMLEKQYAEVFHEVDCTRIATNPKFDGLQGSLGAVYYNFPHSGAIQGFFDGHPMVNWRHENLMRLFFRALRSFVKVGGIVKVSSSAGAIGVKHSFILLGAKENEFAHIETMPFLQWSLHRYGRSYGDRRDVHKRLDASNNQSYNAQSKDSDMVYCFKYCPSGEELPPQQIRRPPTLNTLLNCQDGGFRNLGESGKRKLANDLFQRFVTECGGKHVG